MKYVCTCVQCECMEWFDTLLHMIFVFQNLAHRTLCHLLKTDPSQLAPDVPLPSNLPTVTFAYIKYMWHSGKRVSSCILYSKLMCAVYCGYYLCVC